MIRIVTTRGGVCGRVVNTSNSGCGGRGSSLVRLIVSLNKELYSTLSLFSQVYKWVPATYCRRITLRWTSIPSRGSSNTPGRACFMLSSGRLGLWLVCALYPQALGSSGRKKKKKKKKKKTGALEGDTQGERECLVPPSCVSLARIKEYLVIYLTMIQTI